MKTFDNSTRQTSTLPSQASDNKYISFFNDCPDGMFCINLDGLFTDVNPALTLLSGYTRQELINTLFLDLVLPENLDKTIAKFGQVAKGLTQHLEICLIHKNGQSIHTAITVIPIKSNNQIIGTHGMIRDITARITSNERLQKMFACDPLTRLPNRNQFANHLKQELSKISAEVATLAVMFINLDRFKTINDTLGHGTGDQILKLIAHRLRNCINSKDLLSRLGGDEFLIGIKRRNIGEITQLADNILLAMTEPVVFGGHELGLTASIGISLANRHNATDDLSMIRYSDIAMHRAKARGGNCHQFYSKTMGQTAMRRMHMERTFKKALAQSEFEVYYQPQVNLDINRIVGVEALVRWNHPLLGLISPLEFIPIAEENSFIIPLGKWILETACNQFRHWIDQGFELTRLSVNISVVQLYQQNFCQLVIDSLEKTGLDPAYLELEITETKMLNFNCVKNKLQILREKGVKIAIDDFGTGYSPLSHLSQISIDTLKIDRGFIQNICNNSKDQAIVESIINMAQMMQLNIIVEGVETLEQLLLLQEHNLKEVQGFYFSPPVPIKELEKLLIA